MRTAAGTIANVKLGYVNVSVMSNSDGWKPPKTDEELRQQFFDKHGDDSGMRATDRKWRTLGRLVEKGSRIRDGYLGR